ncbi:ParB/RepB/Spo0J family partition protein [Streptomyces sp. NPDC086519]|uniref:ParB/RepB/Spo0J family partition protein n=1 Tax=Streptomyces sp. NPDC086519 TaxID=3154863 RepID=UPI0034134773
MVAIESLSITDYPRIGGEDVKHTQFLLSFETEFPPILVHRSTMGVIDGVHRLRVAMLRGQREIAVHFFDGSEADAFVLAVQSNAGHGLPLTLADRTAAASRIVQSHPHWSDRAIARVSGLSPKTVAAIRRRSTADTPPSNSRMGQDGRVRPINATAGRELAGRLITANPDMPLRKVAKEAGISIGTAHDVRERLASGRDPVPESKRRGAGARAGGQRAKEDTQQLPVRPASLAAVQDRARNPAILVRRLLRDPSLRSTETGRTLLRLLDAQAQVVQRWDRLVNGVPQHCSETIADLAGEYARFWLEFAATSRATGHDGERKISG